ncbi:MAG: hypothetical protein GY821_03145 [Gammaproteobacteria bacterium]|nr:hypothetical protein [Gammaproteobacteria bacterium]MCP4473561.1 hypothetical protein [Gammaproteobacteria bacterium]
MNNLASILAKRWRQAVARLLFIQIALVVVISLLMLLASRHSAYSALVAGAVCIIANSWFIFRWFGKMSPLAARAMLHSFYRHEVAKLVILIVLMLLALTKLHVSVLPFIATYLLLQFSLLLAPIILAKVMAGGGVRHGV